MFWAFWYIFAKMKIETRSKISAMFLLAVMLSMILCVSLHHHEYQIPVEETCLDCQHHVHHAGHVTTQTVDFHKCMLCQLHSLTYLVPAILHLAIAICVTHVVRVIFCEKHINGIVGINSPRAPPYSCCFGHYMP